MLRRNSLAFFVALLFVSIQILGCSGSGKKVTLTVTGTVPATGTVGVGYLTTLMVSGGTAPYTWTVTGLPAGVMASGLMTPTLTISGTPTTAGTSSVVVTVSDSKGNMASSTTSVMISGPNGTLTITPATLGTLTNGTAVTPIALTATSTTGPYTWTVSSGSLPAGLVLNNGTTTSATTITSTTNSITVTGTPTATGAYSFTLSIADSVVPTAGTGSQAYSGSVNAAASAACAATPALRGNEAALTLPHAFLVKGDDTNDLPVAWAGSITPNGSGGITAADVDYVDFTDGPLSLQVQLSASSYSFDSEGRGCLFLSFSGVNPAAKAAASNSGNANLRHGNARKLAKAKIRPEVSGFPSNVVFSFALGASNQTGRITQFDYANSLIAASGQMSQQTAGSSLSSLASNFVFGVDGWFTASASLISRTGIAGSFANAAGTLSSGTADNNIGGTASGELSGGNGTLTAVSTTTGRGTGSYTITTPDGPLTFDFAYYIVNGSDFYLISSDDPNTTGNFVLSGRALKASATSAPLNGFYLAAFTGIDFVNGNDPNGNNVAGLATIQATSAGAIPTATAYANDAGVFQSQTFTKGTYTLDTSTGRVTFGNSIGTQAVAYVTATASEDDIAAFAVGADAFASSGFLALQGTSAPNFTNASLSGGYAAGTAEDVVGDNGSLVGVFTFGDGTYTNLIDTVGVGSGTSPNGSGSGTVAVNTDGSGTFDGGQHALVTNGNLILAIDGATSTSTQPLLYVFVKQ